jgi:hypothetical protein
LRARKIHTFSHPSTPTSHLLDDERTKKSQLNVDVQSTSRNQSTRKHRIFATSPAAQRMTVPESYKAGLDDGLNDYQRTTSLSLSTVKRIRTGGRHLAENTPKKYTKHCSGLNGNLSPRLDLCDISLSDVVVYYTS